MEVETPLAYPTPATDPHLDCFQLVGPADERCFSYLQSSPEFAMKRLLAAGSGPIYQICKAFRYGEAGRFHHQEFSMLEWYRPGFSYHRLMDEVAALVQLVLPMRLDFRRISYRELFLQHLAIDPFTASDQALDAILQERGIELQIKNRALDRDSALDLLLSQSILPMEAEATGLFLFDFPASQASLAHIRVGECPVAERFELYVGGLELANGFHELVDAQEQRRRFEADNLKRDATGKQRQPIDWNLLAALSQGLPDCSGVALGLDRLLMIAAGAKHISEVLNFPD